MNTSIKQNDPIHKIGAVSALSGVPVTTLRIWEIRYGTFTPHKSNGNQRLYCDEDVLKATLLKRLTEQGHSISTIAAQSIQALNNLLNQHQKSNHYASSAVNENQSVSLAIVGLTLATRIESKKFTLGFLNQRIRVTDVFNDLQEAALSNFQQTPEILLVKVNSLHAGVQVEIHKIAQSCKALHTIVLYNFGQEKIIESLKLTGMLVRREPIPDSELADLIHSVLIANNRQDSQNLKVGSVIPQRKYSDKILAQMAAISTNVLCECPRHVAEIISQLNSFEQYSHDCLNNSSKDAHLHAYLSSISGSARALFESALEVIAKQEGINLIES